MVKRHTSCTAFDTEAHIPLVVSPLVRCSAQPVLISSLLFLYACSTFTGYPKSAVNEDDEITACQPYFASNVRSNEDAPSNDARGGLTRQQYRDAVVYGRLGVVDIRYRQFEKALNGANNGVSTGSDLAVLVLNGLGATTGAAAAKSALAAASGGVVGAKAAINTDLFYKKTLPALVAQMEAGRQKQLGVIKTGLGKSVDEYSLNEALDDVQEYYVAGTLPSAVQQVTSNAGAALATADQNLGLIRSQSFVQGATGQAALLDRILKLTPAQALSVEMVMKQKLSERTNTLQQVLRNEFPGLDNISDGVTAQKFLQSWVVLDDRTAAYQKEWSDALDTGTK
jgi:hypothetical protein